MRHMRYTVSYPKISGRGGARTREILKIGDADGRGRANLKNSGTRTDADSQNRASRTTLHTIIIYALYMQFYLFLMFWR